MVYATDHFVYYILFLFNLFYNFFLISSIFGCSYIILVLWESLYLYKTYIKPYYNYAYVDDNEVNAYVIKNGKRKGKTLTKKSLFKIFM